MCRSRPPSTLNGQVGLPSEKIGGFRAPFVVWRSLSRCLCRACVHGSHRFLFLCGAFCGRRQSTALSIRVRRPNEEQFAIRHANHGPARSSRSDRMDLSCVVSLYIYLSPVPDGGWDDGLTRLSLVYDEGGNHGPHPSRDIDGYWLFHDASE